MAAVTAGSVTAASSSKLMFFPRYGGTAAPMVATVLAMSPDATTYVLGCAAGAETSNCGGFEVPIVATQGPQTAHYNGRFIEEGKSGLEYEYNQDNACTILKEGPLCTWSFYGPFMTHSEYLARSQETATTTSLEVNDVSRAWVTVAIVTDTASIMNFGTDVYGQPTSYNAADSEAMPNRTGTASGRAATPSQTGTTASPTESAAENLEMSKTVRTEDTSAVPKKTVSGGVTDAQATGLQVLAAIAFGGLVIVGAM